MSAPLNAGAVVAAGSPIPHSALIGRDRETARLTGLLDRPDGRLVTITGPGGGGKTRLAVEVASLVADRFADGIAFVSLDDIHGPEQVPMRIGRLLGRRRPTTTAPVTTWPTSSPTGGCCTCGCPQVAVVRWQRRPVSADA